MNRGSVVKSVAAGILGSVPVAVAYSFFVDHYISGLTSGATKG